MVSSKSQALLFSLLLTFTLSCENAAAAGRTITTPANTILNGKGAPKSSLGIDGDFYIDVRSLLIYGPKRKGKWPTPQNLQGPTGASGNDGKNGADGKSASTSNVNSVTGQQGPQGAVGPQGEKGEKGDSGLPGAQGLAGLPGTSGASGPAGPAGANGSNGAQGAQGPAGATGATGPAGPSEVTVVTIPQFTLGTSVGYTFSASESFGNLRANSSYKFEIFIRANSNILGLVLGADVLAAGGSLNFSYIRSDFRNVNYSSAPATYGFLISGTIQISGADSSLVLRIIDAYGDSGAAPLTFTGKAYITLVGAIR
jgi:hypothetical protein